LSPFIPIILSLFPLLLFGDESKNGVVAATAIFARREREIKGLRHVFLQIRRLWVERSVEGEWE
jgi:hypothetical protein